MATERDSYNAAFADTDLRTIVVGRMLQLANYILGIRPLDNNLQRVKWARWLTAKTRAEIETAAEPILMYAVRQGGDRGCAGAADERGGGGDQEEAGAVRTDGQEHGRAAHATLCASAALREII